MKYSVIECGCVIALIMVITVIAQTISNCLNMRKSLQGHIVVFLTHLKVHTGSGYPGNCNQAPES